MKLNISNKGSMYVQAVKSEPAKKPVVQRGGDLRGRPGNK